MTYLDQSLGQLARTIPGATRIFDQYQLDFCCAGNRTLRTAADAAGTRARCRGVCARRATARTRVTRGVRPGRSAKIET